jgi:hypothetical protein
MSTPSPALSSSPAPAQSPGIFARIGSALQKAAPYFQPIADHLAAAFGNYGPLENDQRQQALQASQAQSQRQGLLNTYRSILPDARPEVQPEIAQRMLTIGTTPLRAPLPSSVSDLSSITAPAQQDLQNRADQSQQTGVENQDRFGNSFRPTPAPPMTLPPTPGMPAAPNLSSNIPGVMNPNTLTGDKMPQPATPRVSLLLHTVDRGSRIASHPLPRPQAHFRQPADPTRRVPHVREGANGSQQHSGHSGHVRTPDPGRGHRVG